MKASEVKNLIREVLDYKSIQKEIDKLEKQRNNTQDTFKKLKLFKKIQKLKNSIKKDNVEENNNLEISLDGISNWLVTVLGLPARYIDKVMDDITDEEVEGLKYAYKKYKSGDTGFAKGYVKNLLIEHFPKS